MRFLQYGIVVLLNMNIAMATYTPGKGMGYQSVYLSLIGADREYKGEYFGSLMMTIILATIVLLGYCVIVAYSTITEVPIMIKQTDAFVKEFRSSGSEDSRDPSAFNLSGLVLLFTLLFVTIHHENYPATPLTELTHLYAFILLGGNVPLFFASLRSYIVAPDTTLSRAFVVIYDTLIFRGFFRNHLLLMLFAVAGFRWNRYFCLMLLDVVNNSPILTDILKAIRQPMPQLGVVGFAIFVTVVIYATFGLGYFHDVLVFDEYDDEDEVVNCHSVVACIWLLVYKGVPAGELGDVIDGTDNTDDGYLWRILFDLSFFIW